MKIIEKEILLILFKKGSVKKNPISLIDLFKLLNNHSSTEIKEGLIALNDKQYINMYKTHQRIDIRILPSKLNEIEEIIKF